MAPSCLDRVKRWCPSILSLSFRRLSCFVFFLLSFDLDLIVTLTWRKNAKSNALVSDLADFETTFAC